MNETAADHSHASSRNDGAVAVIVVHGVADQPRGETAEAVATQLALQTHGTVERRNVTLRVEPCTPAVAFNAWHAHGLWQAMRKSFGHALRSDFVDPRLGGADSKIATGEEPPWQPLPNSAAADNNISLGARFTDFLIAKSHQGRVDAQARGDAQDEVVHTAARFDIGAVSAPRAAGRTDAGAATGAPRVSVFEMYWADLSRLPGFAPRIVAELFTLLFDLVRIGGQAVAMHATGQRTPPELLGRLAWWHRVAEHLYTRALATLMLQLVVCALVVVLASTVASHARGVAYVGSLLVAVGAAASSERAAKSWIIGCGAGVVVLAVLLLGLRPLEQPLPPAGAGPLVGVAISAVLLLLFAAYAWALLYWEKRFRAVLGFGIAFGLVTAACITWGAIAHQGLYGASGWLIGAMRAAEIALLAQMGLWCALAFACVMVVGSGWLAGIRARQRKDVAAIHHVIRTGRLGLFASLGAFVVFVTAAWAVAGGPLCSRLQSVQYPGLFFNPPSGQHDGCSWFNDRLAGSTETFALVALMLSLVVGFVIIVLAPCLAAEVRLWRYRTHGTIGDWLTRGYRAMDRLLGWGSWVALAGVLIAAVLLFGSLQSLLGVAPWFKLDTVSSALRSWSADLLQALVIALAGTTTGLLALGRVTNKRLKALRLPLDAALDVDVHFREFPREAIPRVRIVERYVSLLQHVIEQGFRRVVIVAHSQGTVITADLLRYLRERPKLIAADNQRDPRERPAPSSDNRPDRLAQLGDALASVEIDLLTLGCPLRQIYAQRFPALYDWACEPRPAQLGVRRWFNAWGAADYVGRWLWNSEGALPLEVAAWAYDRPVVNTAFERDLCSGAGAHTHYFEPEQAVVRQLLMALLQPVVPGALDRPD